MKKTVNIESLAFILALNKVEQKYKKANYSPYKALMSELDKKFLPTPL